MQSVDQDKVKGALGAIIVQALLVYALIAGLAVSFPKATQATLETFGINIVPPAVAPKPAKKANLADSGAAAPPNLKAHATDVVAPMPTPQTSPVLAAPHAGVGAAVTQGAAAVIGPGSGAGGQGDGTGSGGDGDGDGSGDAGAVLLRGRTTTSDYPPDALEAQASGTVYLRFVVGVDGRVTGCRVTRSSGVESLDETTCRLITKRFRYRPAHDAAGRPVPDVITGDHVWTVPAPPPASDEDAG